MAKVTEVIWHNDASSKPVPIPDAFFQINSPLFLYLNSSVRGLSN